MKVIYILFGVICVYTMGWAVGYIEGRESVPRGTETVYLDVCGPETIGL